MNKTSFGHLAFNCKSIEKSVHFYRDILGFKEKFSLYYSDFMQVVKNSGVKTPGILQKHFEKKKDKVWITYLEISEGVFIELFDQVGAFLAHRSLPIHFGYQHYAIIVEDIKKTKAELIKNGIKIDIDISFGPDFTYQMWIHDPDGNKLEIMQYTERSLQVTGGGGKADSERNERV